jgi:hypothetical protein
MSKWLFISFIIFSLLLNAYYYYPYDKNRWDIERDNSLNILAEELSEKYNMKYLNYSVGTLVDSYKVAWDISLMSRSILQIDEIRPIITNMIQDFTTKVYQDPLFQRGLDEMHAFYSDGSYDPELSPKRIGLRISFWDENMDRPSPPYVSLIKVLEGRIEYYQANEDQILKTPYVETFEEAFFKLNSKLIIPEKE